VADSIETIIRERIASGELPRVELLTMKVWPGTGAPCDGCGQTIHLGHVQVELRFRGDQVVRFHFSCCRIWMGETSN